MNTRINEITTGVYRLSTHIADMDFTFNQFLVAAEEPLLFHTGPRALFPLVSEAASKVVRLEDLRWISFGHVEADECGSMNEWLAAAPNAQVVHGSIGVMVSLGDLADRAPRALADGEVLDLGGKRVRWIDTHHVPHAWEAGVMFEEVGSTLLCGDLFTHVGNPEPSTEGDIVGAAEVAEDIFHATCLTPDTAPTIRRLAGLAPSTLAIMHGSSYSGDCAQALRDLATCYEGRFDKAMTSA